MIGIAAFALLLIASNKSSGATANLPMSLDGLTNDPDTLNRLNGIYAELVSRGLSSQQILFCLSQILFESGILTNVANYGLMNQNNYAGLTTTGGGYASYNSISDFIDSYLGFLSKNNDPLDATSLIDFNNRLQLNHYYTENPATYLAGLETYYSKLFDLTT